MTTKKLTRRQRILVATTLFGMFFGAGNLIFPVHLGQMAGSNVIPAIIGFIITAVGIPIFGVAAIGVTHSDGLQTLSGKVGKGYGIFFTCLLYLTIGPLFAIPRCATVSFTTGVSPMLPEAAQPLALLLFSAVFFAFVLFFSLRPGKITVWIGKIINPVFLLFLAVLVIAALLKPGASISDVAPTEPYATKTSAFFSSFIEGYGTMDAIAGLAFGIVVIDVIRRMGVDNDDAVAVDVLGSGVLTGLLMAVIYVVTILMGTQSRGLFEISDNGGIALTQIAGHYFGGVGQIILAVTITFACLKTSIGLVTSCSETFVKMTHGKISYKLWAIVFTLFSFAVSNVGLSAIIEYSIPVLMLIYPPATALIILAFAGKLFRHDRAVYVSTMIFTWAAAIFDFFKTLPAGVRTALRLDAPVELAKRYLPLFDLNLGWLLPAVIGFVIGMVVVLAEPAIHVLNKQVEEVTNRTVSKRSMLIALSVGVGLSIGLSMLRMILGFSILYYLIPGYIISIGLSFFVPGMYTAIAFDSGGVASGPLTSSFILPLAIGACVGLNGGDVSRVLTDAFGIVAMVAMTPLITIQLLGFRAVVAKRMRDNYAQKRIVSADDEQIIYFR